MPRPHTLLLPTLPPRVPTALLVLLWALALGMLLGCNGDVTSGGRAVTNPALRLAAQSVAVTERSLVTLTDALTAAYTAGRLSSASRDEFLATHAPDAASALATAQRALQAMQAHPGPAADQASTDALTGLEAVLERVHLFTQLHLSLPTGVAP